MFLWAMEEILRLLLNALAESYARLAEVFSFWDWYFVTNGTLLCLNEVEGIAA